VSRSQRRVAALAAVIIGVLIFTYILRPPPAAPLAAKLDQESRPAKVSALVVPVSDAKTYDIPGGKCTLYADCPTNRLSVATIVQDGRYPEKGSRVNSVCTESILVTEGELTVALDGKEHRLKSGDLVYITPGTAYSVQGKAKAVVFIEPKWDKTQNTPTK
jgi:mannose-6-phosphate isomerase-like protein (cupin superfamily)